MDFIIKKKKDRTNLIYIFFYFFQKQNQNSRPQFSNKTPNIAKILKTSIFQLLQNQLMSHTTYILCTLFKPFPLGTSPQLLHCTPFFFLLYKPLLGPSHCIITQNLILLSLFSPLACSFFHLLPSSIIFSSMERNPMRRQLAVMRQSLFDQVFFIFIFTQHLGFAEHTQKKSSKVLVFKRVQEN